MPYTYNDYLVRYTHEDSDGNHVARRVPDRFRTLEEAREKGQRMLDKNNYFMEVDGVKPRNYNVRIVKTTTTVDSEVVEQL